MSRSGVRSLGLAQQTYGGAEGGGPALGLRCAAYPVGVFAIGLMSGTFTRVAHHGALMAAAAAAWGVTVVVLGLAAQLCLALAALVLGGAVNFVLSTHRNAITQALTDDALQRLRPGNGPVRGRRRGLRRAPPGLATGSSHCTS